jgi:hypothetical protein
MTDCGESVSFDAVLPVKMPDRLEDKGREAQSIFSLF